MQTDHCCSFDIILELYVPRLLRFPLSLLLNILSIITGMCFMLFDREHQSVSYAGAKHLSMGTNTCLLILRLMLDSRLLTRRWLGKDSGLLHVLC
jgi:hypothetical protein